MLILTRKKEESLVINNDIEIKILEVEGGSVKLGITAPKNVEIFRKEVLSKIKLENKESSEYSHAMLKKIIKKD